MKKGFVFTQQQATKVGDKIGVNWNKVNKEQFRRGMDVESEHGKRDSQTNVTNDDPIKTGKIALAHLKEKDNYYTLLDKYVENDEGEYHQLSGSLSQLPAKKKEDIRKAQIHRINEIAARSSDPLDKEERDLLIKIVDEEFKEKEVDPTIYMPADKAAKIRKIQENIDRIKRGEKPDLTDPEGAARWGGHEYYIFV